MASSQEGYTADYFKKDKLISDTESGDESKNINASKDEDAESDSSEEVVFTQEDMLISRLYREVVDYVMDQHGLRESNVLSAIDEMKQEIFLAHKKGFRNFRVICFSRPSDCCAYLRRYAICHTGLVKRVMWEFFFSNGVRDIARNVREEIMAQNCLTIISLGGGPGNDLVGFCSALQGTPNNIKKLDLIIVDIYKSWQDVFPIILEKANRTNYGSFSQCLKDIKIRTGFKEADLTADGIFEDHLSNSFEEVDIVLIVKLTSFLPDGKAVELIKNVANSMKREAKLIFIDNPYNREFFKEIKCLQHIYSSFSRYELSYEPERFRSPSISSTRAHIGIYKKIIDLLEEDSSHSESW